MPNITFPIHAPGGDAIGKVVIAVEVVPGDVEEAMDVFNAFIADIWERGANVSAIPNIALRLPYPTPPAPEESELPMETAIREAAEQAVERVNNGELDADGIKMTARLGGMPPRDEPEPEGDAPHV